MLQQLFSLCVVVSVLFISTPPAVAQDARAGKGGTVSGRILDEQSGRPIDYANVVLHHKADSSMALGTISDAQGRFMLGGVAPGEYYLVIHFIGYSDFIYPNITLRRDMASTDVGDIRLALKPIEMAEVEVDARRAPVVYQLDKKVISVDGQLTASSGTAVDVLRNVPSVTVDLDGSVRLRGSGSFTVLIDGRPSVLDASDALQQIPSSAIENIEIITNPSARYNPEGMSGIINVVMKKEGALGNSGMVNLGAGWDDKYGLDGLYTIRFDGFTAFFGADYNKRYNEGTQREVGEFRNANELTTIRSDARGLRTALG
jgi:outer membrane receptor protein involved in Fe transport